MPIVRYCVGCTGNVDSVQQDSARDLECQSKACDDRREGDQKIMANNFCRKNEESSLGSNCNNIRQETKADKKENHVVTTIADDMHSSEQLNVIHFVHSLPAYPGITSRFPYHLNRSPKYSWPHYTIYCTNNINSGNVTNTVMSNVDNDYSSRINHRTTSYWSWTPHRRFLWLYHGVKRTIIVFVYTYTFICCRPSYAVSL